MDTDKKKLRHIIYMKQYHKNNYVSLKKEKICVVCQKTYIGPKHSVVCSDILCKKKHNRIKNLELYYKNIDKVKIYRRELAKKHKERIKNEMYQKYHNDINYRILKIMRVRLHEVLYYKIKKYDKTIKLLGCSVNEFKEHIEKQFKPGMSWDNYGLYTWHIDHIIPCSSFDLTKEEEQRKCFHYTNLQPLWANENLKKWKKVLAVA
jgi:hypothetical protein